MTKRKARSGSLAAFLMWQCVQRSLDGLDNSPRLVLCRPFRSQQHRLRGLLCYYFCFRVHDSQRHAGHNVKTRLTNIYSHQEDLHNPLHSDLILCPPRSKCKTLARRAKSSAGRANRHWPWPAGRLRTLLIWPSSRDRVKVWFSRNERHS